MCVPDDVAVPCYVGRAATQFFRGRIGEIRVWSRGLAPEEVARIFIDTRPHYPNPAAADAKPSPWNDRTTLVASPGAKDAGTWRERPTRTLEGLDGFTPPKPIALDRWGGRMDRPALPATGFVRADNTFAAVLVNYPIHPVALGARNDRISANLPGQVARAISSQLPGCPLVLVTCGACGDLDPPAENVPAEQVGAWGREIANHAVEALRRAPEPTARFSLLRDTVSLPLEVLAPEQVDQFAAEAARDEAAFSNWGAKYLRVVAKWRRAQLDALERGTAIRQREMTMTAVRLNDAYFLTVNAEVFLRVRRSAAGPERAGCAHHRLHQGQRRLSRPPRRVFGRRLRNGAGAPFLRRVSFPGRQSRNPGDPGGRPAEHAGRAVR